MIPVVGTQLAITRDGMIIKDLGGTDNVVVLEEVTVLYAQDNPPLVVC